jgi:hypothetical protein
VHLGVHEHPVKDGEYQDFKDRSQTLLGKQVERNPHATNSSIVMEATKELVGELLLRPEGAPAKTFTFEELVPVLDQCTYICSPSIQNNVTSFKYIRRYGVMDGITCSEVTATGRMSRKTCSRAKALILIRFLCGLSEMDAAEW